MITTGGLQRPKDLIELPIQVETLNDIIIKVYVEENRIIGRTKNGIDITLMVAER